MGLSENVGYIPNEIAIFHRDNDQQNHWVQWGTRHFQTHPDHFPHNFMASKNPCPTFLWKFYGNPPHRMWGPQDS